MFYARRDIGIGRKPCLSSRSSAMARGILAFLLTTWLGLAMPAAAAPDIAPGSGSAVFVDTRGNADRPITIWYHRPAAFTPDSPILFVMHGLQRNGRDYRDAWVPHAEPRGALLVVPEFSREAYPGAAWYNLGNMVGQGGTPNPIERWSYQALEHVFDAIRAATGTRREGYLLYGHSAGGQYVHRVVTFMPTLRIERAVAANPGWYTLPTAESRFPHGLAGSPIGETDLGRAFARPLTLLLGEADTDPNHPSLNRDPETMKQGAHRFARGNAYFAQAGTAAKRLGVPFAWTLRTVPGVDHSNADMAPAAARLLFE
jgi:poly(3-hydroxybutyrate) depolymerase